MPARRELHTGRYNFLHRSWGPLEPFDDSMPEILSKHGIYTHLVTDHKHYYEDGGATYHTRYNTWDFIRGQEGDAWKGEVEDPFIPETVGHKEGPAWRQEWVNRKYMQQLEEYPQFKTFDGGLEFIRTNAKQDRWFLQIETFDPHEPFYSHQKYKDLYPHEYNGPSFDWPPYQRVKETAEQIEHCRYEYLSLVSMCDEHLGKVLDLMDELHLWEDTMLIVNTDHGFLLGEHGWWAKMRQPFYNVVVHTPLFIWDPRSQIKNESRDALVQTIDWAPTLLDFFQVEIPKDVSGKPLRDTIQSDQSIREAALFGVHGGHLNCTDGRYVYMRAPENKGNTPLYNYTLMPTHMRGYYHQEELQSMKLAEPFSFTKGSKVIRTEARRGTDFHPFGTLLFDLQEDPQQNEPMHNMEVEAYMMSLMIKAMEEHDAPEEQYERLGLAGTSDKRKQ